MNYNKLRDSGHMTYTYDVLYGAKKMYSGHMTNIYEYDLYLAQIYTQCPFDDDILLENARECVKEMGRNDLCYCGSGKKQKSCHGDKINPGSMVADVLSRQASIQERIDREMQEKKLKSLCSASCTKCCSDYFYVSRFEYYAIKAYMLKQYGRDAFGILCERGREYVRVLEQQMPEAYNTLSSLKAISEANEKWMRNEVERVEGDAAQFLPCLLLSKAGKCLAYETRPITCRLFGTSYDTTLCKWQKRHLKGFFGRDKVEKKLVNVGKHDDQQTLIDLVTDKEGHAKWLVAYPLFYWFANDAKYADDYRCATEHTRAEYAKRVLGINV